MNKWLNPKKGDEEIFKDIVQSFELNGWKIVITTGKYGRGFDVWYRANTWPEFQLRFIRWFSKNPLKYETVINDKSKRYSGIISRVET